MSSLHSRRSAAMLAMLLPGVVIAQSRPSSPAPFPAIEIMGLRLRMTRAQADSVTAARGWSYADATEGRAVITAGDENPDGTMASLGPILCELVEEGAPCPLAKEIVLEFDGGVLSAISVRSPTWPLEHCMDSWHRYKAMEQALRTLYGEPPPEPESDVKPDVILGVRLPQVTWLLRKGRAPFSQDIFIAALSGDGCSSMIMIRDMSKLYD